VAPGQTGSVPSSNCGLLIPSKFHTARRVLRQEQEQQLRERRDWDNVRVNAERHFMSAAAELPN